jgi:hypothetical protein
MANNAILFNAALQGYMGGMLAGQNLQDPVQADYAAIVTQAVAWATELDSLIANDLAATPVPPTTTQISIAGGAAIVPAGSTAVFESQLGKANLIFSLSFGQAFQRFQTGALAASFATAAAAVRVAYFQAALSLVVT